jgi:hypothetical protein
MIHFYRAFCSSVGRLVIYTIIGVSMWVAAVAAAPVLTPLIVEAFVWTSNLIDVAVAAVSG